MSVKTDTSYGIVPVRYKDGRYEMLLIHQISNVRGDSYWIIPKGHPEPGEGPVATALRELKEETGLAPYQVDSEHPLELRYTFWIENTQIDKTVIFYIGYIETDAALTLRPAEVKEAKWLPYEEACAQITHKNARSVVEEAFALLESQPAVLP